MLLSVVIVNWNGRADLAACLAALARQTHGALELIVVDNGSTDGSAELVRARFAQVKLIEAGANLGFAAGCNRGIAASTGPWVAMLNNDTVADERWAEAMVRAAALAPERCGMLQSLMLYQDRPETINSAGIELDADGGGSDRLEGQPRAMGQQAGEIFCPTAGAAAYRRAMLDAIALDDGWFDARHFMYFEDMDLGWRARLAGWSARYVPDAVVAHRWHGSTQRHGDAWLAAMAATNRWRTLAKNASWRFIFSARLGCWAELRQLWRAAGAAGVARLVPATVHALRARTRVTALARCDRHDVERAWARG